MNDYERLESLIKKYEEQKDISRYAGITLTEGELKWVIERMQELKKEKNHYRSVLSELKFKPTHTTTGQYTARATRMINRALKKWRK